MDRINKDSDSDSDSDSVINSAGRQVKICTTMFVYQLGGSPRHKYVQRCSCSELGGSPGQIMYTCVLVIHVAGCTNNIFQRAGSTGQMMYDHVKNVIVYLCSPFVRCLNDLEQRKMYLADIPIHDVTRDLLWMELMSRWVVTFV